MPRTISLGLEALKSEAFTPNERETIINACVALWPELLFDPAFTELGFDQIPHQVKPLNAEQLARYVYPMAPSPERTAVIMLISKCLNRGDNNAEAGRNGSG